MSADADTNGLDAEVLIVGAGPAGLMLANLLGRFGVRTLVVEAQPETVTEPRAVSVDDEAMRTLQAAGLLPEAEEIVLPGTGTRYVGADGRTLAYVRGPDRSRLGFPVKNPIYQPEFERMLADAAGRHEGVEVRFGAELTTIVQNANVVEARLRSPEGAESVVRAAFAVGCDGGRSRTRQQMGIEMEGSSFRQPWLVVDTTNDPHDERYAVHLGDWRRPTVVLSGRGGRCRYEFLMFPDEDRAHAETPAFARTLLAQVRPQIDDSDLIRHTVYTFHALVARQWRQGRVLLAGDAAHMMPPFAGQGLNSGLRDAQNLAWKLGAVLRSQTGTALLDTYEQERRPHTEATIALSVRLGRWMMTTSRRRAWLRDRGVRLGMRIPPVRRWVEEMRYKPTQHYAEGAIWKGGAPSPLLGRMLPQPLVLDPAGRIQPLDELLGPGFSLLAIDVKELPGPVAGSVLDRMLGIHPVHLATGDRTAREVYEWSSAASLARNSELESQRERLLLVRPDRIVAAVLPPQQLGELEAALPATFDLEARPIHASSGPAESLEEPDVLPGRLSRGSDSSAAGSSVEHG